MRKRTTIRGYSHPYQQTGKPGQFSPGEKKRLYILCAVLLVAGLVGIAFAPGIGGIALYRQHQRLLEAEGIVTTLETDNKASQGRLEAAKKDPDYLEGVARAEYNMVQPDEIILDYSKKK